MPKYRPSRVKRATMSVRLAFSKMNFNVAQEWVMAYRELTEPTDRIRALERAMEFVYPKMSNATVEEVATIEMELEAIEGDTNITLIEEQSTDELLAAVETEKAKIDG